jgi:hypothetical protein
LPRLSFLRQAWYEKIVLGSGRDEREISLFWILFGASSFLFSLAIILTIALAYSMVGRSA